MSTAEHVFVGFGFGPIQAGLFAKEAAESGRFAEIVIAEVDAELVAAVRGNGDRYVVNVAHADRIEAVTVSGVRLLDPAEPGDAAELRNALARATEIVTALPSTDFYTRGGEASVAQLIAQGLQAADAPQAVIYTAENNNHAAEILEKTVMDAGGAARLFQVLNTVIGKMSQVVTEPEEMIRLSLAPVVPGYSRAFLVEAFNRIQVSRITLPGFQPGITAFEEKDDLLPFEEAKLFGHNAAHTMLGFLGARCGARLLADMRGHTKWMQLVRRAFVEEAGAALIAKYGNLDEPLFTPEGFSAYADDLLARMTNPYLADTVARAIRDPLRKLGRSDRLFGAMRLCLACGIEPLCLAVGALAGLTVLLAERGDDFSQLEHGEFDESEFDQILGELWGADSSLNERVLIASLLEQAQGCLAKGENHE